MSFVITKAGMWHAKGLEIAIDEMEGGRTQVMWGAEDEREWEASQNLTIEQKFPNASLQPALESPRKLFKNNNSQAPHTDVSDSVFLTGTQGSEPKLDFRISKQQRNGRDGDPQKTIRKQSKTQEDPSAKWEGLGKGAG